MYSKKNTEFYGFNKDKNIIDEIMLTNGGTLFENTFVSGPDTPRGLSEVFSGNPSYINGCNTRLKYPAFFLNSSTFIQLLLDNEYKVSIFASKGSFDIGIFPFDDRINKVYDNDFDCSINFIKYLDDNLMEQNEFVFMSLHHYHTAINRFGPNKAGVRKGLSDLKVILQPLTEGFLEKFDLNVIFSDHGHLLRRDYTANKFTLMGSKANLSESILSDHRVSILNYWKIKSENSDSLFQVNKLVSASDIFTTLMDCCNLGHFNIGRYGINLFSDQNHEYFLIEDFLTLDASISEDIEVWRYIDEKMDFVVNKHSVFDRYHKEHLDKLTFVSESFKTTLKLSKIIEFYNEFFKRTKPAYRPIFHSYFLDRIFFRFIRIFLNFFYY